MILHMALLLILTKGEIWFFFSNFKLSFLLKMFNKIRFILKIKFGHISVTFYSKEQGERGGLTVQLLKLGHLEEVVVAL